MAYRWHTVHSRPFEQPLLEFVHEVVDEAVLKEEYPTDSLDYNYELEFALTVACDIKRRLEGPELARRRDIWVRDGCVETLTFGQRSIEVCFVDIQIWNPKPWRFHPPPVGVDRPGEYSLHLYYAGGRGVLVLVRMKIKILRN